MPNRFLSILLGAWIPMAWAAPLLQITDAECTPKGPNGLELNESQIQGQRGVSSHAAWIAMQPKWPSFQQWLNQTGPWPKQMKLTLLVQAQGQMQLQGVQGLADGPLKTQMTEYWQNQKILGWNSPGAFDLSLDWIHHGSTGDCVKNRGLRVDSMDVQFKVVGSIVQVSTTMVFYNPEDKTYEGELVFPMPSGAVITGYALDVQGRLVDGVAVPKDKARKVFEAEKRQKVDPGYVEWVDGNQFRTRVYPLPARGYRKVKIEALVPWDTQQGQLEWTLAQTPLRHFQARLMDAKGNSKTIAQGQDTLIEKPLVLALGSIAPKNILLEQSELGRFFRYEDHRIRPTLPQAIRPKNLTVFWDVSGSRDSLSQAQDLQTLTQAIQAWQGHLQTLTVLTYAHKTLDSIQWSGKQIQTETVQKWIQKLDVDGASSEPEWHKAPKSTDLILAFGDGHVTLTPWQYKSLSAQAPVWTLTASNQAHLSNLKRWAQTQNGQFLDTRHPVDFLSRSIPTVVDSIQVLAGQVEQLNVNSGMPWNEHSVLMGQLHSDSALLRLWLRDPNGKKWSEDLRLGGPAQQDKTLAQMWALNRLQELYEQGLEQADEVFKIGQKFGLVTPRTSLLVLESLDQYLRHSIRPPASWPEMRAQYDIQHAQGHQELPKSWGMDPELISDWTQKVRWWQTDFSKVKDPRHRVPKGQTADFEGDGILYTNDDSSPARSSGWGSGSGSGASTLGSRSESRLERFSSIRGSAQSASQEQRVGFKKASAPEQEISGPILQLKEWTPETPYLKALGQSTQPWQTYLSFKPMYRNAPSFYADCAEFFFRHNQPEIALRILGNLAEMGANDPVFLRIMAHSLARHGLSSWSLGLFQKVKFILDEEPQSWRDYALELIQHAQRSPLASQNALKQEAWENLNTVVQRSWPRFNAMREIALTERNALTQVPNKANTNSIPYSDILSSDLRIVLSWDADEVDVDLWVDEPSHERVDYSHNRSRHGGRLSRDFTQGYGPEEYMIRKAKPGIYTIRAHFYGSHATRLQGAVTLRADVYARFGMPDQNHQILNLRLDTVRGEVEIGKVKINKQGKLQAL